MDTEKDWQRNWTIEAKRWYYTKLFEDAVLASELNEWAWTENMEPSKRQKRLREWPVTCLISWLWAVQCVPFGEDTGNHNGKEKPFWKQLYCYSSGLLEKTRGCSFFHVSSKEQMLLFLSAQEEMFLKTVHPWMRVHCYWVGQEKWVQAGFATDWDYRASIASSKCRCWNRPLRRLEPEIPRVTWWPGCTIQKRIRVHIPSSLRLCYWYYSKTLKLELVAHALRRPAPRQPPSEPRSSRSRCAELCKIPKREQINYTHYNQHRLVA